jgi:hypothetical protein
VSSILNLRTRHAVVTRDPPNIDGKMMSNNKVGNIWMEAVTSCEINSYSSTQVNVFLAYFPYTEINKSRLMISPRCLCVSAPIVVRQRLGKYIPVA